MAFQKSSQMSSPDRPPAADALENTLSAFQSLGDNCEFGLVQRYVGCEPLGLFRFTTAPLDEVVRALDSDLEGYGGEGDLSIFVGPYDFLCCASRRYGFHYSTGELAGTIDPAVLIAREYRKVAYLRRRLLEDLAAGEKIFVRKGPPEERFEAFATLARAVRRHGACPVLRVVQAESEAQAGTVRRCSEGVLEGYVRRFSPYEGGMQIELEPWIDLARNAEWLARDRPGRPPPLDVAEVAARYRAGPVAHATGGPDGVAIRTAAFGTAGARSGAVHVFSAWVWIPAALEADRVFGVFGRLHLTGRDADLGIRDAWQRVWVSAALPSGADRIRLGLGAIGPGRQRFWSTGWQLSRGPLPPAAPVPTARIGRGLGAWLARLRP